MRKAQRTKELTHCVKRGPGTFTSQDSMGAITTECRPPEACSGLPGQPVLSSGPPGALADSLGQCVERR